MADEMIRVLIVDDQRMFAESIKYIIESRASDIEIVGIAYNGREAIEQAEKKQPHIILMDVRMPVMDGVEATMLIRQRFQHIKILMLTTFDDDEYVLKSLKHGAVGYLLKSMPPIELINAIRAVQGGIMQIDPAVSKALIGGTATRIADDEFMSNLKTLTQRELQVLELMVQALDNIHIAKTLNLAEQTVRNYISTIYSKLGVEHRMDVLKIIDKINYFLGRKDESL
ncbi:MAG: response regulator transcription factor [Treponemataceae bacterium]